MLLSDPLPLDLLGQLGYLATGQKVTHIPQSVYGADEYGQLFELPLTGIEAGDGEFFTITKRGRVCRATMKRIAEGYLVIDQQPIPFGGSWDSAEERQFRQWAGLAS